MDRNLLRYVYRYFKGMGVFLGYLSISRVRGYFKGILVGISEACGYFNGI